MSLYFVNLLRVAALVAVALCATLRPDARTWRLNPNESASPDFTSLDAALNDDRVKPGDELLLDPGNYSGVTMTKENITITGPGYFLSENFDWPEASHAYVNNIELSKGSTIRGCTGKTITAADNAVISRCQLYSIISGVNGSPFVNNITVEQCYISASAYLTSCKNSFFRNNIFPKGGFSGANTPNCIFEYNTMFLGTGEFKGFTDCQIRNNIVIYPKGYPYSLFDPKYNTRCTFERNVISEVNENPEYPNNIYGATVENTFVDNLIADRYYLRDDSPAKGKATGGGDCGAFGGPNPYVLSGIPLYTPHITEAVVPARPTDGSLNIQLKIAVQDE